MEHDLLKLITGSNTKGNVRYITISDNCSEHWPSLLSIVKSNYDFYAYIYHDADKNEDGSLVPKHLHILAYDMSGTTLKAHCERFSSVIPPNFICKVKSPRAMARYLIHKDNKEKHQYAIDDVQTSDKDKYLLWVNGNDVSNSLDEYHDFLLVKQGKMSIDEYIQKYQFEFARLNFYQKNSLYHKLSNIGEIR